MIQVEIGSKNKLQDEVCRKLGLEKAEGCVSAIRIRILIRTTVDILLFIAIVGGSGPGRGFDCDVVPQDAAAGHAEGSQNASVGIGGALLCTHRIEMMFV